MSHYVALLGYESMPQLQGALYDMIEIINDIWYKYVN